MTTQALSRLSRREALIGVLVSLPLASFEVRAQYKILLLGSTETTEDSGLFAYLLPAFSRATGIQVRPVVMGTGRILELGRRGDLDVLLVHDRAAEEKFVSEGHGLARRNVMYNDFVLIGPKSDPAGTRGRDIVAALTRVAATQQVTFISRGDDSGTHMAELRFWKAAGIDPAKSKVMQYHECNCDVIAALGIAESRGAYVLADRSTWISFQNRGDLAILVEGDARLFNQYGVIVVNPEKHRQVRRDLGQAFADWVVSPVGQRTIAAYRIGGEQLFFPNATP